MTRYIYGPPVRVENLPWFRAEEVVIHIFVVREMSIGVRVEDFMAGIARFRDAMEDFSRRFVKAFTESATLAQQNMSAFASLAARASDEEEREMNRRRYGIIRTDVN